MTRSPWRAGSAVVVAIAIVVVAGLAAVVLTSLGGIHTLSFQLPGGAGADQQGEGVATLLMLGVWQIVTITLTLLASAWGDRPSQVLALRRPAPSGWAYLYALVLMMALQVALSVVQQQVLKQDVFVDLRPFLAIFQEHWTLAFLVVGIGAPLAEELLFRGFLLPALSRSRLGFGGAAILSTALWTALHAGYSVAGIADVFLVGLFFSWLLWRTGSLWVPILCHALYNSLLVITLRTVPLPA